MNRTFCKHLRTKKMYIDATPEEALRMKLQLNQGAVPTITVRSAAEIDNPNAAVLEMFDRANRMAKE